MLQDSAAYFLARDAIINGRPTKLETFDSEFAFSWDELSVLVAMALAYALSLAL